MGEQQAQAGQEEGNQQESGDADGQPSQDQMAKMQEQWAAMNESLQGMNGSGFGYDGMLGAFPNMAFNSPADYSQMMQYMQNAMQSNMTGTFPNMMCKWF